MARFFDRDIFRQVARHYELRADAQSWETLIAYSFIADAGQDTLQIHQLMARAIQARLSPGVLTELHELLRDIWRDRALQAPSVTTWREAAFHAASAQPSDIPSLLIYADQLASAGKPGLDSMRTDLTSADLFGRYGQLISLLAAEASLLVGDASNAHAALGDVAVALPQGPDEIDDRIALRADLARLRWLAHRFAFDHEGAARHAAAARAAYAAAGHQVGLANITINEAEILAVTDPAAAVAVAGRAIEVQQQLGAEHEVGKGLTALGLAHLGLGDLAAAGQALDEAAAVLEHCGYRSGRARAELIRALWHARPGRLDQAESSAAWSVAEFEAVEVYPTMVLVAGTLLDRIGRPDPMVSAATARAGQSVQPLRSYAQLESSIADVVARLVADDWNQVYTTAMHDGVSVAGFYHKQHQGRRQPRPHGHPSGAKSDPSDARTIADMVRTKWHTLRPVAGDSDLGRGDEGSGPGA